MTCSYPTKLLMYARKYAIMKKKERGYSNDINLNNRCEKKFI